MIALMALGVAAAACSPSPGDATTPTTVTTVTTTSSAVTTTAVVTTTAPPAALEDMARAVMLITPASTTLSDAERRHLGRGGRAVILFGPNITDAVQLTTLTSEVACAAGRPVLVAVDQELGRPVRRLGAGMVTELPTPDEAAAMPLEDVHAAAALLGRELLNFGINVDLAPVIDVVTGANPVLADRHLGPDPDLVAVVGAAFVTGLAEAGVVAVPKHFPGHGRTVTDPHDEPATVTATERDLAFTDWPPFESVFAAGAPAVMIGHPVYTVLDATLPASLSPATYLLLREGFGFDGVAVTDALGMRALADFGTPGELAVAALSAGADLLLFEDPAVVGDVVATIIGAALDGTLDRARLAEAAARVDRLAEAAALVRCSGP